MALETGKVATDLLISGVAKSNEPAMIVPNSQQGRPVKEKSKKKEDDMEGLPADVAAVNALQAQYMADGNITIQEEITLKSKLAALKPRLEAWQKARDVVERNNASAEYAIDDRGFVYVKNDKGGIDKRHVSSVNKYDTNRLLTYGELLDATFNKYAFDDNMLNAVSNAVTASMAQKKFVDLVKQAEPDSASATSGSGSVDRLSDLNAFITRSKKSRKKWTAVTEDRLYPMWSALVRDMDSKDRYALILKGRLSGDDIGNNDEAAVLEAQIGWLGRSVEDENLEDIHYTSLGGAHSGKKNGDDNDSDILTSSEVALNVLSDPNLQEDTFNFGDNGNITLKTANATQTLNSSATSAVTARTLGQLIDGKVTTDKMSFYMKDKIFIGNKKIRQNQYNTIAIDGNHMKTTFIPFRNGEPDLEVMNEVANIKVNRDIIIADSNVNSIANELNNYFNNPDGKFKNIKIIDTADPEDIALVKGKTVDEAIKSYFERNYTKDFKNEKAVMHPCDICYATFSIGTDKDGTTFSENELKDKKENGKIVKKVLGLNNIENYDIDDKDANEREKFMTKDNYKRNVISAFDQEYSSDKESKSYPDFLQGNKKSDQLSVGRGLLILPHRTGVWARAFNVDLAQIEKRNRNVDMYDSKKENKVVGNEKQFFKDAKGNNQYTPLSN